MKVKVILSGAQDDSVFTQECEDLSEAFDVLLTTVQMGRAVNPSKFPSLMPRLRDQTLLNFARWLTDGTFGAQSESLFIQLCDRKQRSTTTADVKRIAAFGVADALNAALKDPECWEDFDAKFAEFKRMCTENDAR